MRRAGSILACLALLAAALLGFSSRAFADTRIALIVGNSHYANTPELDNPGNDATDIAAALTGLGFKVALRLDATKRQMDQALAQFSRDARGADAAVFYYAGHGMQFQGRNFLMPVDAELRDEVSLRYEMTSVDEVRDALQASKGVKILVLDSCRDNPLASRLVRSITVNTRDVPRVQGLARAERTNGMIIVYSTQADEVANDGAGRNSPFSAAFVKQLKEPGLEVGTLFRRVEEEVFEATNGRQSPELSISMVPEYYINRADTDQMVWARIRSDPDAATLREFIARYPKSFYLPDAKARLDLIDQQQRKAADADKTAAANRTGQAHQAELDAAAAAAKAREQELSAKLAAAEAAKAKLGEELNGAAAARAQAEEEIRRQAAREEEERAKREAALKSEIERLQASDAEKQTLLQKAIDEDRARVAAAKDAQEKNQQSAKDAAEAKARTNGDETEALKQRIASLEAEAAKARAEAEAEAKRAAEARAAASQQVASAAPLATQPAALSASAVAVVPSIRQELRRLGCYVGGDLEWDAPALQLGVAKYVRYANLSNTAPSPDASLLDDMKKRRDNLCPPECSAREVPLGGKCVAKTCPSGETLARSGACIRPAPAAPRAVAVRSPRPQAERPSGGGGHCFVFNGNQYCE